MSRSPTLQPLVPSSLLYGNADQTVVVVDVPRSIEEAQEPWPNRNDDGASVRNRRRLLSGHPPISPFPTPSGLSVIDNESLAGQSLTAKLAELTAQATVDSALAELHNAAFDGPWCLPRCIHSDEKAGVKKDVAVVSTSASFHIPPGARYLAGTIEACRDEFLADAPEFNVIVLDPPWPNRSARRRRQGRKRKSCALDGSSDDTGYETAYNMQSMRELLEQIPVGAKLAATGNSLVAVWVTNKAGCEAMLTDPRCGLFRDWGVELVATWTWLKVTTHGEPVVPLDSQWRKPWERLLIARRPVGVGTTAGSGHSTAVPLPTQRVIVGVPDLHSRKPNLRSLLLPFVAPVDGTGNEQSANITGLEVFARNLTAGWWAWGNEALLFQHKSWWTEQSKGDVQAQADAQDGVVASAGSGSAASDAGQCHDKSTI
ncbi:mt-a70 family [Ophiostoma piceae UAMH 11346]|uniref:Mt-a70 family n=1 Tax=Ophiostoma piceae (strain UAMH 11346) TaxID=1262450 RepID=S3C596_OPHP1|nr:mt-a70 family [Ophiostoma piceae UAMH 11346]